MLWVFGIFFLVLLVSGMVLVQLLILIINDDGYESLDLCVFVMVLNDQVDVMIVVFQGNCSGSVILLGNLCVEVVWFEFVFDGVDVFYWIDVIFLVVIYWGIVWVEQYYG